MGVINDLENDIENAYYKLDTMLKCMLDTGEINPNYKDDINGLCEQICELKTLNAKWQIAIEMRCLAVDDNSS